MAPSAEAGDADPLSRHQWRSRVLVVFAAAADDPNLLRQRDLLARAGDGVAERDLVVVEAVGGAATAAGLRRALDVPEGAFRSVLVGKDGSAKLVSETPIEPDGLFAAIDGMPMRRREIEARRKEEGG